MPRKVTVPKYDLHAATGTARCRWTDANGRRQQVSLGKYGSPASKKKYAQLIARIQGEAEVVAPVTPAPKPVALPPDGTVEKVGRLATLFHRAAMDGYSKSETAYYEAVIEALIVAHSDTNVADFGPKALAGVRDEFVSRGWTREHVNAQVRRTKRIFQWGESQEYVPAGKFHHLDSLPGLRKGKTTAPEQQKVKPVADATVEATLPFLSPTVAAMVQFHRLTGCRPQDVCNVTPGEIDRTGDVWVYRPEKHKTAWRGHDRTVYIGPQAQAVIEPYLGGDPALPVFSPKKAWVERLAMRRAVSPVRDRYWRPKGDHSLIRDHYDTHAYIKAIRKGCLKAGVEPWTPNQLRHAAVEEIRFKAGLDAAQEMAGHKDSRTTERYASPRKQKAEEAAKKHG